MGMLKSDLTDSSTNCYLKRIHIHIRPVQVLQA